MSGRVEATCASPAHSFSKPVRPEITLIAGIGVAGDAHAGTLVQHRSRLAQTPRPVNLRQVHLIHAELFDQLAAQGFTLAPGDLGENITTRGMELLSLPRDTELHIGDQVRLRVTGLRNPCAQIEAFAPGLLRAVTQRNREGEIQRLTGVMAQVVEGGVVRAQDAIHAILPPQPHHKLERV